MDEQTKAAIEESIVHWEDNLDKAKIGNRKSIRISWRDCALCKLSMQKSGREKFTCIDCPVSIQTGKSECLDTPYQEVFAALDSRASAKILITAIQKEINFLKTLLHKDD